MDFVSRRLNKKSQQGFPLFSSIPLRANLSSFSSSNKSKNPQLHSFIKSWRLTDRAVVTSARRFVARSRTFWGNCWDHTASVFNLRTHKRPCDQLRLQASCFTQSSSVSITLKCQVSAVIRGRANVGMKVVAAIKASGVNGYRKSSFCTFLDVWQHTFSAFVSTLSATILMPQDWPQNRE